MNEGYLGTIILCAFNFTPRGWAKCEGQLLPINSNSALFSLLGTMYGGDGRTTFGLPDLRNAVPVGAGNNYQGTKGKLSEGEGVSTVALNYCICIEGMFPYRD